MVLLRTGAVFPKLGIDFCLDLWYNSYISRNVAPSQPLSQL